MPSQAVEKLSVDSVADTADTTKCPIEMLYQISEQGLPLHKLTIKEGRPVMLLWSLDPKKGLCNDEAPGEIYL